MLARQVDTTFWQSKRVLLTGHTGFKGSWLSIWLRSMGADICGVALPPSSNPSLFTEARLAKILKNEIIDIRDFEAVDKIFRSFKPEIVIHMAAQPLVRLSYQKPIETYATNVMGTIHVLEASRNAKSVKAIVNVTTDKCYENQEWVWGYREDDQLGGHDPYSNSKGCSELVSKAYTKSFLANEGIALATARAGNVIGGGDWSNDRLIPDILNSLSAGKAVEIRHPHAIRPWQHVLEPLSGYLLLAEELFSNGQDASGSWNFGPNDEDAKSVKWIVEKLCEGWHESKNWKIQDGDHPHEAKYLKLDISKARHNLAWEPRWPLRFALGKVSEWHRGWLDGQNAQIMCHEQILQFITKETE